MKFCGSFGLQFAENVQANWQEEYYFFMTMPDPIQPEQPRREFKKYSGNFLNIRLTVQTWPLVASICLDFKKKNKKNARTSAHAHTHIGGKYFADDEEVEMRVQKWLKQQSKNFYAAGFDALVKRWEKCINVGEGYVEKSFLQVRISHVLRFISICGLFTGSPSYKHIVTKLITLHISHCVPSILYLPIEKKFQIKFVDLNEVHTFRQTSTLYPLIHLWIYRLVQFSHLLWCISMG
jgi:hypothetical protein